MPGPFYFAWSGPNDATQFADDEDIFAITITQTEGDFATLAIDVQNPHIGLLAAGRNLWGWLSYAPEGQNAFPIYHGRLIGIPENLQDEIVRLQFVAKPVDYQTQKVAVAATLQVPPFWDPVWLQDKISDPDTALESRTELWHIDRVTLEVSSSDIIAGEDGVVDVTADDHFYDAMTVTYGQTPLRRVSMTGTVTWDQAGGDTIDLTAPLVAAFRNAGSPLPSPLISSLTGDGLLSSWPVAGTSIGGGWSMGVDSFAQAVDWIKPAFYTKTFVDYDVFPTPAPLPAGPPIFSGNVAGSEWPSPETWEFPDRAPINYFFLGFGSSPPPLKVFVVAFPVHTLQVKFTVDWTAKRSRSETVSFTLDADVQSIITDPGQDDQAAIDLSSAAITLPIDPGGATPLFDPRSPIYFKTDRGKQSVEYLLMLARAKLLARSRCVLIKFATSWDFVISWISCRYSVRLFDPRLPGGVAEGKITGYTLSYSTDGIGAEVTIGCTVGHGGTVGAIAGVGSFLVDDVVAADVQTIQGGQVAVVPGQIVYSSLDDFDVADDGIDLFNMTEGNVLQAFPAVDLGTTGDITAGDVKIVGLASTTGMQSGSTYAITGLPGQTGPIDFLYDGGVTGTMSVAALITAFGVGVHISGPATNGFTVTNGLAEQAQLVDIAVASRTRPDPIGAVKGSPTRICVDLVSPDGGMFHTDYPLQVETMTVPQTINLEAP